MYSSKKVLNQRQMLWGEVHVCGDSLGFSSMVMMNVDLYNNPTTHNQMFLFKQS